jgi:hypothetical protein
MHPYRSIIELQVFINSFEAGLCSKTLEHVNSRRLLYLLEAKQSLVSNLEVIDVNSEIRNAV